MTTPQLFIHAVELHMALGLPSIKELGGVWRHRLDDHWYLAIVSDRATVAPPGGMQVNVPPFTLAVWWNGWLAGFIDLNGGCIAAGSGANEDALIAALRTEIKRLEARP